MQLPFWQLQAEQGRCGGKQALGAAVMEHTVAEDVLLIPFYPALGA